MDRRNASVRLWKQQVVAGGYRHGIDDIGKYTQDYEIRNVFGGHTARDAKETPMWHTEDWMDDTGKRTHQGMKRLPSRRVRILLLAGDRYGANCFMGGRKLSIVDTLASYGWDVTTAGINRSLSPCSFSAGKGASPIGLDCTIDEVDDVPAYDAVSILPGPSYQGLIASNAAMTLVREAMDAGLVISGWCRGVRILAAADAVRGKRVVCHADDRQTIENAGGIFVGHDHPPIIDGRLVTGARSYYYRVKNADAIRAAVIARREEMTGSEAT
jgi:putative intracellular protease/amidase